MPKYTIDLPGHLVPGLNRIVGAYNADTGAGLTVAEWLSLHAAELAIQDELIAEHKRLTENQGQDLLAGLAAYKDRVIAGDASPEEGGPA